MKDKPDSDRTLTRLLAVWKVKSTPKPDFQELVWARLDTDSGVESKVVRPPRFSSAKDRRIALAAAAVLALFAIPLADFTADQHNDSRLEQGRERYLRSIISVSSVTATLSSPAR